MATTPNDAASREALEKYNSDDTQPATARLKKRKAASAYLARQRHKSFVGAKSYASSAAANAAHASRKTSSSTSRLFGPSVHSKNCPPPSPLRSLRTTLAPVCAAAASRARSSASESPASRQMHWAHVGDY